MLPISARGVHFAVTPAQEKALLAAVTDHGLRLTSLQGNGHSSEVFAVLTGQIPAPISSFGEAKISAKTTITALLRLGGSAGLPIGMLPNETLALALLTRSELIHHEIRSGSGEFLIVRSALTVTTWANRIARFDLIAKGTSVTTPTMLPV
jgi:hypothetical protein